MKYRSAVAIKMMCAAVFENIVAVCGPLYIRYNYIATATATAAVCAYLKGREI